MELSNLVFVTIATALPRDQNFYKSCFAHCIHQPNLILKDLTLLDLLRLMLSKCHYYTPEPRFQTTNGED